tara:strand:- start:164 stop:460 length:297 start_codon:yes stop_codon:yes gene_type:complete
MIRYPSVFWFFIILISGIFIYEIKNLIILKEKRILSLEQQINITKDKIKLFNAEFSYLSRPERIEQVALNLLGMKKILPIDIWDIRDLSTTETNEDFN